MTVDKLSTSVRLIVAILTLFEISYWLDLRSMSAYTDNEINTFYHLSISMYTGLSLVICIV